MKTGHIILIIVALLIIVPFISFTILARKAVDKFPQAAVSSFKIDKILNWVNKNIPASEQGKAIAKVRLLNDTEIDILYQYVIYMENPKPECCNIEQFATSRGNEKISIA